MNDNFASLFRMKNIDDNFASLFGFEKEALLAALRRDMQAQLEKVQNDAHIGYHFANYRLRHRILETLTADCLII